MVVKKDRGPLPLGATHCVPQVDFILTGSGELLIEEWLARLNSMLQAARSAAAGASAATG